MNSSTINSLKLLWNETPALTANGDNKNELNEIEKTTRVAINVFAAIGVVFGVASLASFAFGSVVAGTVCALVATVILGAALRLHFAAEKIQTSTKANDKTEEKPQNNPKANGPTDNPGAQNVQDPNPPGKPVVASDPVNNNTSTSPAPEFNLALRIDQQHWMTKDQKISAKEIVQKSLPAAKPGFVKPLELKNCDPVKIREVMDFLLLNGAIVAWSTSGYHGHVGAKLNANDRVDPLDRAGRGIFAGTNFVWIDKDIVETERGFKERNKIKFSSGSYYDALEISNLSRWELLSLDHILRRLNDFVKPGPYAVFSLTGHERNCLEFLRTYGFIHSFDFHDTHFLVHRTKASGDPQPTVDSDDLDLTSIARDNIPEWFGKEQKQCVQTILKEISAAKPGQIVPVGVTLPTYAMQGQVMDHLLLYGVIAGWNRSNKIHVKIKPEDDQYPDEIRNISVPWRELKTVLSEREFQEMNEIRLRPEHLERLKDSKLSREQIIAVQRFVYLLNERIEQGPYADRSYKPNETEALAFMKANGLIYDYDSITCLEQDKYSHTDYTINVTPADVKK